MTFEDHALSIAGEQYSLWKLQGLTHHEMVSACQQRWQAGMTGDDVVEAMVRAWHGLERRGVNELPRQR